MPAVAIGLAVFFGVLALLCALLIYYRGPLYRAYARRYPPPPFTYAQHRRIQNDEAMLSAFFGLPVTSTRTGLPFTNEATEEYEMITPAPAIPYPPPTTPRRNITPLGTQAPPGALFAKKSRDRLYHVESPSTARRLRDRLPIEEREEADLLPPLPAQLRNFTASPQPDHTSSSPAPPVPVRSPHRPAAVQPTSFI